MAGKMRISERELAELHGRYKNGTRIEDLAAEGWQRWGYKNVQSAASNIYTAFKRRGWYVRTPAEARSHKTCPGCGCLPIERTSGCKVCTDRHYRRKRAGLSSISGRAQACKGCGCPIGYINRGCQTCYKRGQERRRQERLTDGGSFGTLA